VLGTICGAACFPDAESDLSPGGGRAEAGARRFVSGEFEDAEKLRGKRAWLRDIQLAIEVVQGVALHDLFWAQSSRGTDAGEEPGAAATLKRSASVP
jgi:hypothetical protein